MTLKQLEYFLAIAKSESITRAAEELHVSQPPLSLQLKALEDELGVALFHRDKKGLTITHSGRVFQLRVQELFEQINEMVREVRERAADPHVSVRVGTINSASNRLLPSKIYAFNLTHPSVDIQISEASTTDILFKLDDRKIDLGIVREPFNSKRYHMLPVFDEALREEAADCFVTLADPRFYDTPEGGEIKLSELSGLPIILHRRYISMFSALCKQSGFIPDIICKNNDITALLNWAKAGIGVAVIPYTSSLLNTDPHLIQKVIVEPAIPSRVYVVWNKDTMLPPEAAAFVSLLSQPGTESR